MFVPTSSTPDPSKSCSCQQHICATSHDRPESRGIPGRRCYHVHVTSTVLVCFATVRHSLLRPALITLLRALVVSKLHYCSVILAGAPAVLLSCFQSVLNAADRLVFSARKFDHMSSLLSKLH